VLAADRPTASGIPRRSVSRWYLDPGLPRSVGFGPVSSPPLGAHAHAVQAGPRPVEPAVAAELVEQQVVQPLPHPGALPVPQPPPTGDRAAAAKLPGGQQPPGDARAQLVDDPRQGGAVIDAGGGRRSGMPGWAAAAGWPATAARGRGSRWWWSWPPIMLASRASSKNQPKVGNTLLAWPARGIRVWSPPDTGPYLVPDTLVGAAATTPTVAIKSGRGADGKHARSTVGLQGLLHSRRRHPDGRRAACTPRSST
jgi:hypothetical protein